MTSQNADAAADPGWEERRQREREARRRYRESHADRMREYKRAWREHNAAHIREYRAAYDAAHPDEKRAEARRYAEKKQRERRRKQARQASSQKYYEANKAKHHEYTRQWRLRKLAEDPDGYRAARALIQRRWYEKHRDERNAKLRAEHRENPEVKRAAARAYYAAHAEEQKAKRRAYYAANREKVLASNRAWKDREKRRRDAGLPPRRLHTTPAAERRANTAAADAFFAYFGPAGLNPQAAERISQAVGRALADPGIQEKIRGYGLVPSHAGPAATGAMVAEHLKRWEAPVKASGFKPE